MWMKHYLRLDDSRATWAFFADALIARALTAASKRVDRDAQVNLFLQTWKVNSHTKNKLPEDLRLMINTAHKHGLRLDVLNPAEDLKELMPIWYHIGTGEGRSSANSVASKCLRDRHGISTVLDTLRATQMRHPRDPAHRAKASCQCGQCARDRSRFSCENPHRCAEAAEKLVHKLIPLWKPDASCPTDGLSLTKRRKDRNIVAKDTNGRIIFDPSITEHAPLSNAFRIFDGNDVERSEPSRRGPRRFGLTDTDIEVYTDGSCIDNGLPDAKAGSGVWFATDDSRNIAERVPGDVQSNQTAEIFAVTLAARAVPKHTPLHLVTD
ncbi:hypothetical protein K466DRAFT_440347, partial [Polyporus arcularius HHB13444]